VDRPSTHGKMLKKEVSFITQPKRQHEGKPVYENLFCGAWIRTFRGDSHTVFQGTTPDMVWRE
jgi:hypothetical protein